MQQRSDRHHVVLTGATGLIGHYLLARLLSQGARCAVVVRNLENDAIRLKRLLQPFAICAEQAIAGEQLVLLGGDLLEGISLAREFAITDVVHLAGCTRFLTDSNDDPSRTNVGGTQRVLEWASDHDIKRVHFVSTAYAAGRPAGPVPESPLPRPAVFNNDYERSKWTCERLCLRWAAADAARCITVMRPSIVVGDWATGRTTSMSGLYLVVRAAQVAARQAVCGKNSVTRRLDLRVPAAPDSEQNIVPVDYVADMIAAIVSSSAHHGGTYNLVHHTPTANEAIRSAIEVALGIRGLVFEHPSASVTSRSRVERLFHRAIEPICPYLAHSPGFARARTATVETCAHVDCPTYDQAALGRMCAFAVAPPSRDEHGPSALHARLAAEYFEEFLPTFVERSTVARLVSLTADVRFVLTDVRDGHWLCAFRAGRLTKVQRSSNGSKEDFGYRVDVSTLLKVVANQLDPQEAFLSGRVEMFGDVERALKMAMVLRQFNSEFPFHSEPSPSQAEARIMVEVIQESVCVTGARRLAGELAYSIEDPRAICLLVNPHPYMGGRMDNNVITRVASELSAAGIATLRFDYSGVGSSEGPTVDVTEAMAMFWQTGRAPVDALMVEDASRSLRWLRQQHEAPLFIAGYSFGAYVAAQIMPPDCTGLILVSPTILHHDVKVRSAPAVPKLVIASDNDFATDTASLTRWLEALQPPKLDIRINGGQHFFRGLEHEVASAALSFCKAVLEQRSVLT